MDSLQFYPNTIMKDSDEVITQIHVNRMTSNHNEVKQGSAAILLILFLIFFMSSRRKNK